MPVKPCVLTVRGMVFDGPFYGGDGGFYGAFIARLPVRKTACG